MCGIKKDGEFSHECCEPTVKHSVSMVVWGSMCCQRVDSLVRLEGRIIVADYMLQNSILHSGDDFIFQHYNVPIHTVGSTCQ